MATVRPEIKVSDSSVDDNRIRIRTFVPQCEAPELRIVDKPLDANWEGCLNECHNLLT